MWCKYWASKLGVLGAVFALCVQNALIEQYFKIHQIKVHVPDEDIKNATSA